MIAKGVRRDKSERLIGCSDVSVRGTADQDRIEVELCQNGQPFETIVVPDDFEVVFLLSDAKGAKGEKLQTISLRRAHAEVA